MEISSKKIRVKSQSAIFVSFLKKSQKTKNNLQNLLKKKLKLAQRMMRCVRQPN